MKMERASSESRAKVKNTARSSVGSRRAAYFRRETGKGTSPEEPTAGVWVWLSAEKDDCRRIHCSSPSGAKERNVTQQCNTTNYIIRKYRMAVEAIQRSRSSSFHA